MTDTIQYLGGSLANFKAVKLAPGPNVALLAAKDISLGLGVTFVSNVGWDADALAAAWNDSVSPLLQEIIATANEDGSLLLTQNNSGKDFEVTVLIDGGALQVSTLQQLTFSPVPSGGTFTLSDGTLTTGAITYSATPSTLVSNIQTAINALSGYAVGDVVVTSLGGNSFQLDFSAGRFAGLPVSLWTANTASLTGGNAGVNIATTQQGNAGTNAVLELVFGAAGGFDEAEVQTITLSGTTINGATWQASLDSGSTFTAPLPVNATGADLQIALEETFSLTPEDIRCYGQAGGPYKVFFSDITNHPEIEIQINQSSGEGTVPVSVNGTLTDHAYYSATGGIGSGSLNTTNPWQIGNAGGVDPQKNGFLRFTLDVPQGKTIQSAMLGMKRNFSGSSGSQINASVNGSDVDDASVPANGAAATSQSFTSAASNTSTLPLTGLVDEQYYIDVTTAIQEIINRAGFVANNHVALNFLMATNSGGFSFKDMSLTVAYLDDAPTDLSANVDSTDGGHVSSGTITSGEFNLTITGGTAGVFHVNNLPYNVAHAALQSAIIAVAGASAVAVTGGPAPDTPLVLTFGGALQKQPVIMSAIASFGGTFSGAIEETIVRSNIQPQEALNVWDLEVCPGQGTLAIDPSLSGVHNYIVLTISEPTDQLQDVTVLSTDPASNAQRKVYVRLYDINALRIQRAINEAFGADVCRVTRVTHSHEWRRIVPPAGISANFDLTQPIYCWYYRDVFRIVFVNRFSPENTIDSITVQAAPVSDSDNTPSGPDAWMIGSSAIPSTALPYDLAEESERTYLGFTLMASAAQPLHLFSASRCTENVSNLLAYKYKLAAQWGDNAPADYSGISTQIVGYKINFRWVRLTKNSTDESDLETVLATSADIDWDSTAEQIQAAIEAMDACFAGNVFVTGSLYNSWKPEEFTDVDNGDEDYDDLLVQLKGKLAYLPLNEHSYELRMGVANSQYPANTSYTREITPLEDVFSVPLPPFRNLRLNYRMIDAANNSSFQVAYGSQVVTIPTSSTPAAVEALINSMLGSMTTTFLPEKFTKAVKAYGVPLSQGALELEFTGYSYQQAGTPNGFLIGSATLALITTDTAGVTAVGEIETLTITGNPFGGTYTLTATPGTTGSLAYNANAAAIQTALQLLTGYTTVTVTGTWPSFTVTFPSSLGDVVQLTATPSLNNGAITIIFTQQGGPDSQIAIFDAIPGRGPNYYEVIDNYLPQQIPGNGDTLIYDNAVTPVYYGIDQVSTVKVASLSAHTFRHNRNRKVFCDGQKVRFLTSGVAPAGLVDGNEYFVVGATDTYQFQLSATLGGSAIAITSIGSGVHTVQVESVEVQVFNRYTGGVIGLPIRRSNNSLEYLPLYLTIPGMNVTFGFTGDEGPGITMFKGDTGDLASDILVNNVGQASQGLPNVFLLFNNVASTLVMHDGSVGVAFYTGEESLLGEVQEFAGELTMCNTTCTTLKAGGRDVAVQNLRACHIEEVVNL